MVIDDKGSFLARFAPEVICDIAIGRLGSQLRGPRCRKSCAVQLLMTLCAGRNIGPACRTLVVDNLAQRLIENLVAILPDLERQVGILIVGWRVSRIQTPGTLKERFRYHDTRCRTVVDIPEV